MAKITFANLNNRFDNVEFWCCRDNHICGKLIADRYNYWLVIKDGLSNHENNIWEVYTYTFDSYDDPYKNGYSLLDWLNPFDKTTYIEENTQINQDNLSDIISSMLEYTAVLTQDIILEASKYNKEDERMFIKGAAWMLYYLVKNRGQRHAYIEKNMSLDEAIQHCTDVLPIAETAQCAKEHMQLRDWLIELKQYRENKK